MKPLVGIASLFRNPAETSAWIYKEYFVNEAYVSQLENAGALPYILPYLSPEHIEEQLQPFSAILVPGGMDLNPLYYHEEKKSCTECPLAKMDSGQLALIKTARQMGKWIFGICRGIQEINVAFGGSLHQDITEECPKTLMHLRKDSPYKPVHNVTLKKESHLYKAFGTELLAVNSMHHQCIKTLGSGLTATAVSEDGIIEGIEADRVLAVQWHPEALSTVFFPYIVSLLK